MSSSSIIHTTADDTRNCNSNSFRRIYTHDFLRWSSVTEINTFSQIWSLTRVRVSSTFEIVNNNLKKKNRFYTHTRHALYDAHAVAVSSLCSSSRLRERTLQHVSHGAPRGAAVSFARLIVFTRRRDTIINIS